MSDLDIKVIKNNLITQLDTISKDILNNFPTSAYIEYINNYPQYVAHKFVSIKIKEITTKIIKISDLPTLEIYHKLILINLMQYSIAGDLINTFPADIKILIFNNFKLILEKIISPRTKKSFFLYSEDKFNKYMAIARLKMIPCGAQKIYAGSLPKKFLFSHRPHQFLKGISLIIKAGGRKPFFKMKADSTDKQLMREFNPEGWDRFFKRVGELLKTQKEIKGVCGGSWLFDPILKEISPELYYIREISARYGALFFYQGSNKRIIQDATFMSPKRIKLFDQREYIPTSYLMIITRKNLLSNLK